VMTDPLAALRELDAARTPGPWPNLNGEVFSYAKPAHRVALVNGEADAAFIAACSTALPLLIEVVEAARELIERAQFVEGEKAGDAHLALVDALTALSVADTPGKGQ
jgi:hypothetical protein